MRKTILTFGISFLWLSLQAQSACHDAAVLSKLLKPQNFELTRAMFDLSKDTLFLEEAIPILVNYCNDPASIKTSEDLNDAYAGNPFISPDNGESIILLPNIYQAPSALALKRAADLPSAGTGPFVTNLADGLAKFLVKRTKEELTITFFQRFKDKVKNNPYFGELFPQTTDLLGLINNEIYQFNAYLETLREHFVKDLKSLPINFKSLMQDKELLSVSERIIAEDMLTTAQMLLDKEPPNTILTYLGKEGAMVDKIQLDQVSDDKLKNAYKDVAAGFEIANLLSESLRSVIPGNIWIKPKELKHLFEDERTMTLFLGLIWQKSEKITFTNGTSVRSVLEKINTMPSVLEDLKQQIAAFSEYAQEVEISLKALKAKKASNAIVYDDYYQFFHTTFSLLETGIEFKKELLSYTPLSVDLDDKILAILRHMNELNFNIRQKHYTSAVTNLVYVFQELLSKDKFTFKADLLKYGNFMALVAEAESSDEVATAIEAVALPVGSSITKKYASFSVAINAYTGFSGGEEFLEVQGKRGYLSVAAPIGFSFSKGFNKGGSLSLFTPLLDVGALAAFRFKDETTNDLPDLNIKNILAPGGYLVYGFGGDIPLSLGAGVQLGPNLRAIETATSMPEIFDNGWRWGVFLSVDIPLFDLYVR